MKIAVSATGKTLDDNVDPRFGRCQYFFIGDPDTMEFEAVDNTNSMAGGGAGISTGQMIAEKGASVVLTGNCGPNAHQVLTAAGINVITGVSGKVSDVVQAYKSGQFQASSQPNVADHYGMGGGGGAGSGMGGGGGAGSGMGGGGGMGMGRGMGRGMGMAGGGMAAPSNPNNEIETLKSQIQMLAKQVSDLQQSIQKLGNK